MTVPITMKYSTCMFFVGVNMFNRSVGDHTWCI